MLGSVEMSSHLFAEDYVLSLQVSNFSIRALFNLTRRILTMITGGGSLWQTIPKSKKQKE
jgi:hypothetical protein